MIDDKTLIRQTIINFVQYNEYRLNNEMPTTAGDYKTELEIKLLKKTVNIKTLITAWENKYPSSSVFSFDRVVITFGFNISAVDDGTSYIKTEPFSFDLDSVEDVDELTVLWIKCDSADDKLNLNITLDESEESIYTNLVHLKCVGCSFKNGLKYSDRNGLIVDLEDCEIYDNLTVAETRENKLMLMYLRLNRCVFKELRGLNILKLKYVYFGGCSVDSSFTEDEETMNSLTSPTMMITDCEDVRINDFDNGELKVGFQFVNNDSVDISRFSGRHIDPINPLKTTIGVVGCNTVNISSCPINGINIMDCNVINVSDINPIRNQVQNSDYLIQIAGAKESVSIANLEVDYNVAKNPIIVSLSSAEKIGICACKFEYDPLHSITLKGNTGIVTITDCVFIKNENTCVLAETVSEGLKFIDCTFDSNSKILDASTVGNLEFVDCNIRGSENGEINKSKDLVIGMCENVKFSGSFIQYMNLEILDCGTVEFKSNQITRSYIDASRLSKIYMKESLFESTTRDGGKSPFIFEYVDSFESRMSTFKKSQPLLTNCKTVLISDNTFSHGFIMENSGSFGSYISSCDIGDKENPESFVKSIEMTSCTGIKLNGNSFYGLEERSPTILKMTWCNSCYFDMDNVFPNKSKIIVTDGELNYNNNIFVIDTTLDYRPSIAGTSNYSYLLYLYNRKLFNEQYPNAKTYETIEEIQNLKINAIAYVDPNEPWVKPFLVKIKNNLNSGYSNISS